VLQQAGELPESCTLRQCKYLNNVVEQDHRFVKHRVNPGLGFGSFRTARCTLQGYEAMHIDPERSTSRCSEGRYPHPEPSHRPPVRGSSIGQSCEG
jgi:transposase-like protein